MKVGFKMTNESMKDFKQEIISHGVKIFAIHNSVAAPGQVFFIGSSQLEVIPSWSFFGGKCKELEKKRLKEKILCRIFALKLGNKKGANSVFR